MLQGMSSDILRDLAEAGRNDLFFFDQAVLKYSKMTEDCHGPLCAFVQHNPKRFKRVLMPRDHYKSTVITIGGNLWKVARNPEERIHIMNEKQGNAERFLRSIRMHAEGNQIFRTLYSEIIPPDTRKVRWNDHEVDFVRSGIYPEPTFSCSGITSATTSQHFSHICVDDPISKDAVQSELVMEEAIQRLRDITTLLTDPMKDTIWVVGTRWAFHDVYSWFDANFSTLTGKFSRSVIEDGLPIFPELLDLEMIDIKRKAMGEYMFSCIMMNNPRNAELQDLDVDALLTWTWTNPDQDEIAIFNREGECVTKCELSKMDITATVDLAPAETANSDRNAVVVLGIEPTKGYAVVLEVFAERCTPLALIEKLFQLHQRFAIRKLGIEGVAYQKAFKYFLTDACQRRGIYMNIVEIKAIGKKEVRIKGLQPLVKVGRLAVHPTQQLLKTEMADFPLGEHDDTVDALSMQLQIAGHWFSQERIEKYLQAEKQVLAKAGVIPDDDADVDEQWFAAVGRYGNSRVSSLGL